jgi:hypothetical protein
MHRRAPHPYPYRLFLTLAVTLLLGLPGRPGRAAELAPKLSEPLQIGTFFSPERYTASERHAGAPPLVEPLYGVSHQAREGEGSGAVTRRHRIHGEAGGKINLLEGVALSAAAKLPLYDYETRTSDLTPRETDLAGEISVKGASRLSWRSELGVNLGMGMGLDVFYDRARFGDLSRPGVEEREERFGTRFIIRFK